MARKIRILDDHTINEIAAGEVVERPSSVVKELLENSLDAGASSISVDVFDGGKKLVSVMDDGCGMSREDAEAAFKRHATSKLVSIEDLQELTSYGFRGEALASIAAVSRMTLRTRESDETEGTEVVLEGGKLSRISSVGCTAGTEVRVEDLFASVPARRKSLKSKNVELAHIREVLVNYMLCKPGLTLSLRSEDEILLVHSSAEGVKGSLVSAFGPKVADNMLFGSSESEGMRVEAFLGRLEHSRSSSADLKLFVNDRPVRSAKIGSAVISAYGSRLMKDRYPVGVVRIFLEPSAVDVNVHPTKREVRFEDEAKVCDAVSKCVEKALGEPDLSYKYDLTRFSESFEPEPGLPSSEMVKAVQETLGSKEFGEDRGKPLIVPLAQIMSTYILAESQGNLLLVDQHAASERIVYESLLQSIKSGKEISQEMLSPLVVHLSSSEERVLEDNRETLEKAGFKIERFGKDSHAIRTLPTVLGVAQGESSLRNILGDLANMSPSRKLGLDVIWRVACHTAVRAGDPLSEGQMRKLLSELMRTENPYTCEHGRPTMIVLSPVDLEKLFKRRV